MAKLKLPWYIVNKGVEHKENKLVLHIAVRRIYVWYLYTKTFLMFGMN